MIFISLVIFKKIFCKRELIFYQSRQEEIDAFSSFSKIRTLSGFFWGCFMTLVRRATHDGTTDSKELSKIWEPWTFLSWDSHNIHAVQNHRRYMESRESSDRPNFTKKFLTSTLFINLKLTFRFNVGHHHHPSLLGVAHIGVKPQ